MESGGQGDSPRTSRCVTVQHYVAVKSLDETVKQAHVAIGGVEILGRGLEEVSGDTDTLAPDGSGSPHGGAAPMTAWRDANAPGRMA